MWQLIYDLQKSPAIGIASRPRPSGSALLELGVLSFHTTQGPRQLCC